MPLIHRRPHFSIRVLLRSVFSRSRPGFWGTRRRQYQHMYPLAPEVEAIAVDLRDRFMAEVFATAASR